MKILDKIKNYLQRQREISTKFYQETGMPLNRFTLTKYLREKTNKNHLEKLADNENLEQENRKLNKD